MAEKKTDNYVVVKNGNHFASVVGDEALAIKVLKRHIATDLKTPNLDKLPAKEKNGVIEIVSVHYWRAKKVAIVTE